MPKVVREKYEAGVLVSREVEGTNASFIEIAKLCMQLVIAVSVALIAACTVLDTLGYTSAYDPNDGGEASCTRAIRS